MHACIASGTRNNDSVTNNMVGRHREGNANGVGWENKRNTIWIHRHDLCCGASYYQLMHFIGIERQYKLMGKKRCRSVFCAVLEMGISTIS
jgi:hypothetical protein